MVLIKNKPNMNQENRLFNLLVGFGAFFLLIVLKLFYLQVIKHDYFIDLALKNQQGYREVEAHRGEIFIQDFHSGSDFRVATNTTLPTLFVDPSFVDNPTQVASSLFEILFNSKIALEKENQRVELERAKLPSELLEQEKALIVPKKSISELKMDFIKELEEKVAKKYRDEILLVNKPDSKLMSDLLRLSLPAVEVNKDFVKIFPKRISDQKVYAKALAPVLDMNIQKLERLLLGENRYVVLQKALSPEQAKKVSELKVKYKQDFKGVGLIDEVYRFYPENSLAGALIGYKNQDGGQYGMELFFDDLLDGENGVYQTQIDGLGKQIAVSDDSVLKDAVDGSDVYLTIDRSIQMVVEDILEKAVNKYDANFGQVIVMRPKTGEVLAMTNYPDFDLNNYAKALETEVFEPPKEHLEEENYNFDDRVEKFNYSGFKEFYYMLDEEIYKDVRIIPEESEESGEVFYKKYKNNVGPAVFRNKAILDTFEPGSVFKPVVMAAALDVNLVTPQTMINDDGPITVDEFKIDNALSKHYGEINMTEVLETSNNIGMAWIAQNLGRKLMYSYIERFGFNDETGVFFYNEPSGRMNSYLKWANSELVTHSFGQGLTVTPLQMISSFSALANDGVLMKPTLVKKIVHSDGRVEEFEPQVVRRAVSSQTASKITAMLTSVVDNGQAQSGQIPGYSIAGKTGTAQTYKKGKPLEGPGTTYASFLGYLPASNPEVVVMVKLDKPKTTQWAGSSSLPTFTKIADYLINYLNIPPDRKKF